MFAVELFVVVGVVLVYILTYILVIFIDHKPITEHNMCIDGHRIGDIGEIGQLVTLKADF